MPSYSYCVLTCPRCGQVNPDGFRFCGACAALLAEEAPAARDERKVVTVLFADLVGFTSRAEQLDPEDVRATLTPYYARLRTELERFGGTVEKFIGDAVVALFGAPVAHEDDPERAVRSALAIRAAIAEDDAGLQVRIAVNTGEAFVALGAEPNAGEGMASGDVVNTTARLQRAAPVNGILVGETTYRATRAVIEYRRAEPVQAKGKSEPIRVWEVVEARSRVGVDRVEVRTPLVGRRRELDLLLGALERVRQDRGPQLVTLVGVPGIGKSRLIFELFQAVEADPELIFWRRGRSLPYGEGVTFWALAEMVKAQAGILDTDSAEETQEKLRSAVLDAVGDATDAFWVEGHLQPLVGLSGDSGLGADRRAESFAAWRRFFEALAERAVLVLVFEDLHWADDNLLDFVDHLVDWATGVPMLVVGAARPELFERRPGWGGGKRNALTTSLSPLTEMETARLLGMLLERPVLPAASQAALLAKVGGNPLYAEQYARMFAERAEDAELPLPETIQGIVAARVDSLAAEEKALLQDASVVGKVFWSGALASISGVDRSSVGECLHTLERKEFVRRERRSSVADEDEYSFGHALVRDVAYSQIPRLARAEKHQLAAAWLESLSLDRGDDQAEMLAYHYLSVLELTRAVGQMTPELEEPARVAFREAGDRASRLHADAAAARFYEAALRLWPRDDPERPELLLRYGRTRGDDPSLDERILDEAHHDLLAGGDTGGAAEAQVILANVWWARGRRDRVLEHMERAVDLVRAEGISSSKAVVLANASRFAMLAGQHEQAIEVGSEALRMAEELGLAELQAIALMKIGTARALMGDRRGLDELKRSFEIAEAINSHVSWGALVNLGSMHAEFGELERAWELHQQSRRLADRYGVAADIRWERAERVANCYYRGLWDESLRYADDFIAESEAGSPHYLESFCRGVRGRMRLARGDVPGAHKDAAKELELARLAADPQLLSTAISFQAWTLAEAGQEREADALVSEQLSLWREGRLRGMFAALDIAWTARALRRESDLLELLDVKAILTPWFEAARRVASGDLPGAADLCVEIGTRPEEAYARLRCAELFVHAGRRPAAEAQLERALAFYRSVGATTYMSQAETLLSASA
jgi:class 3 adenylate cyclase/tetratricopeptide (TPR) repeat protein